MGYISVHYSSSNNNNNVNFGLNCENVSMGVETDRNSFSFSAPKMTIFDGFGHFRFRPKMYLSFSFFSFSAENRLLHSHRIVGRSSNEIRASAAVAAVT